MWCHNQSHLADLLPTQNPAQANTLVMLISGQLIRQYVLFWGRKETKKWRKGIWKEKQEEAERNINKERLYITVFMAKVKSDNLLFSEDLWNLYEMLTLRAAWIYDSIWSPWVAIAPLPPNEGLAIPIDTPFRFLNNKEISRIYECLP